MAIEIGGAIAATNHDFVDIAGAARLGGLLKITMANGYIPSSTATLTVFNAAGGITGSFATASNGQRLPTVDGIGSFIVKLRSWQPLRPE